MHHKWQSCAVWFLRYGAAFDGHNFLSFWTFFCRFTPLSTQKIKVLKKLKKCLEILPFYTCVPQMKIIWCMVSEILSMMDSIFCHLDHFYPPNNPKNQNFEKIKKTPGDIITLHMCTINENHMIYGSWDMEHVTDRIFCHFGPLFSILPP